MTKSKVHVPKLMSLDTFYIINYVIVVFNIQTYSLSNDGPL